MLIPTKKRLILPSRRIVQPRQVMPTRRPRLPKHAAARPSMNQMFGYRSLGFGAGPKGSMLRVGLDWANNSTTGSKTLAPDMSGATPTASLWLGGRCNNWTGTYGNDSGFGIGFDYASGNIWMDTSANDAAGTSDSGQRQDDTTESCVIPTGNASTDNGVVTAVSYSANQISFTHTGTGQSGYMACGIGGNNIEVATGSFTPSNTLNGSVSISGLSFQPVALIIFVVQTSWDGAVDSHIHGSIGFCDSALNQGSCQWADQDGQTSTVIHHNVSAQYVGGSTWSSNECQFEITAINSDGFDITTRNIAYAATRKLGYIAIGGDASDLQSKVRVGVGAVPSGTSGSVTGVGFKPKFLLKMSQYETTADYDTAKSGWTYNYPYRSVGIAVANESGTISQACTLVWSADNAGTSDEGVYNLENVINSGWHDNGATHERTMKIDSFDADGYSWSQPSAVLGGSIEGYADQAHFDLLLG